MDIELHGKIYTGLKDFVALQAFSNGQVPVVVKKAPKNPTYPLVRFAERRNQPIPGGEDFRQMVSSIGFEVSVYMNDIPTIDKETTVREVMKCVDYYLSFYEGLRRVSLNYFDEEPYRCLAMYACTYYENKQILY